MAMYYQGSSEIQADGLQTLYLMNPNYVGYSDTTPHPHPHPQPNMLLFNSSSAAATTTAHALSSTLIPHAPPQQFLGIPLSHDPSRPSSLLAQQESIQAPRFQYNIWNLVDQAVAHRNQTNTPQALSLSLSAHQTGGGGGGFDKPPLSGGDHQDFQSGQSQISPKICSSSSLATTESNGVNSMQSVIMGSKYLKAAQELLDEVASVGKGAKNDVPEGSRDKAKIVKESNGTAAAADGGGENKGGSGDAAELTTAQRQEIQMKKAKLCSMLDEVEQRYRQYHHQMQIVVASFEQVAGIGSAKSYTQLALKTILKQFRCLKSTISAQIKALSRSLGNEESFGEKLEGSRLKFVDHQLRQQRALQQLGMMQNNAWRPQRGLPERAVSVLRAWLFEHFLHPYPKDSDKHMLAKQTGLTRSQVSNWFINARVRLWKPMVEEMYQEEMKTQEQISPDHRHDNKTTKPGSEKEPEMSKLNPQQENQTTRMDHHHQLNALQTQQHKLLLNLQVPSSIPSASTAPMSTNSPTGFAQLITSLNMENQNLPDERTPKKSRNENSPSSILSAHDMEMKAGSRFGAYGNIGDQLGRFNADHHHTQLTRSFQGNNFSLSLGLPPSETSQGAHKQNFVSHRDFEFGTRIESGAMGGSGINNNQANNIGYEILDFQNRKTFPAQLLPDFVA